jgi:hypothetical protein
MVRKPTSMIEKTKTSFIVKTVDEKFYLHLSREQLIREMTGWLTRQEAEELRQAVRAFERIYKGD